MTYDLNKIRALLLDGFSEEELRRLCFYEPEFKPLEAQLPQKASKAEIIDHLLKYVEQKLLMETLLAWAKKNNLARYEEYQPYENTSTPNPTAPDDVDNRTPEVPSTQLNTGDTVPMTQLNQQPPTADFVIVTALEEERDAVLDKLPGYQKLPPAEDDVLVYFLAKLPVTFTDASRGVYRVVVTTPLDMGRVHAAAATSAAIRRWCPRYVILIGIAGGISEEGINLGDVLVSDQIVDYELQKLTRQGPSVRWKVHPADASLIAATRNFITQDWHDLIKVDRPQKGKPKRYLGPIASGDKVIAFNRILAKYRKNWPKLIGVEMEAGGVAAATFQAASRPGFFMVRSVSDLADEHKNSPDIEQWRLYACDVAAAYTIALLQSGPVIVSSNEQPPSSVTPSFSPKVKLKLESPHGTVHPESKFYIEREADDTCRAYILFSA